MTSEQKEFWQRLHEQFGWNLIPLKGKIPVINDWNKYSHEKCGFEPRMFEGRNAGVVCGPSSNLLVLDVDDPVLFEALVAGLGLHVPETFKVKTSKGYHLYFTYPHGVEANCRACKHPFIPKVSVFDVRGAGGQVVAPMSIHPETTKMYILENDCAPAAPPDWLIEYSAGVKIDLLPLCHHQHKGELLDRYVEKLKRKLDDSIVEDIINGKDVGERSEAIAKVLCKLLIQNFDEEEIIFIFNHFAIGDKYREKKDKLKWLRDEINRCNDCVTKSGTKKSASIVALESSIVTECDHFDGLILPKNYGVDKEHGIRCLRFSKKGKITNTEIITICDNPVFIEEISEDVVNNKCYYNVCWYNNGAWTKTFFPRKTLSSSRDIEELLSYNIRFTSNESKMLIDYFRKFVAENWDKLPRRLQTSTLGWQPDMTSFVLGERCITPTDQDLSTQTIAFYGSDEGERQYATALHEKGGLEDWLIIIQRVKEFPIIMTGIYAAFASVLLKILDAPSFVYDVAYKTSTGKSTLQALSASVWGNTSMGKGSIVHTWNNTVTWIDNTASMLSGLPLYLDDTKTAGVDMRNNSSNTISNAIYSLASGKGRGRATKDGTQTKSQWSTVMITNGEQKITEFTTNNGGMSARCLSIWGHPFNGNCDPDLINELKGIVRDNYGLAGPAFVQDILNRKSKWLSWKSSYQRLSKYYSEQNKGNEVAARLSEYLAVIHTTGSLLAKCFPDAFSEEMVGDTMKNIVAVVSENANEADRAKGALEITYSWFARNSHKFEGSDGHTVGETFGRVDDENGYIAFLVQPLREFLNKEGYEDRATLRTWGDNGWLHKSGGKSTTTVRVNGKSQACFRVSFSTIEQVLDIKMDSRSESKSFDAEPQPVSFENQYSVF